MAKETMQAGRELDALVAEKVMGLDVRLVSQPVPVGHGGFEECPVYVYHVDGDYLDVPEYSTDIAAAWQVVNTLAPDDMKVSRYGSQRRVSLHWDAKPEVPRGYGDTVAHAICLAALRACGVNVEEVPR